MFIHNREPDDLSLIPLDSPIHSSLVFALIYRWSVLIKLHSEEESWSSDLYKLRTNWNFEGIFCERKVWDKVRNFLFERLDIPSKWHAYKITAREEAKAKFKEGSFIFEFFICKLNLPHWNITFQRLFCLYQMNGEPEKWHYSNITIFLLFVISVNAGSCVFANYALTNKGKFHMILWPWYFSTQKFWWIKINHFRSIYNYSSIFRSAALRHIPALAVWDRHYRFAAECQGEKLLMGLLAAHPKMQSCRTEKRWNTHL